MNELPVFEKKVQYWMRHPETGTTRRENGTNIMQRTMCSVTMFRHGTCVVQNVP